MGKNEKITHLRQLSKTVDSLIEAIENSNPVDYWNYTEEQLLDRNENVVLETKYFKVLENGGDK